MMTFAQSQPERSARTPLSLRGRGVARELPCATPDLASSVAPAVSAEAVKYGESLRARRRKLNLLQADLASAAKVSLRTIGRWERGQGSPDRIQAELLRVALLGGGK